jgi:hypothetical protein
MQCINVKEHEKVDYSFTEEQIKKLNNSFSNEDPTFLGLHSEIDNYLPIIKSYYYIGYRWLDENTYINISPKKETNFLQMFMECLEDEIVSKKLDKTYKIFFDEPWIELDDNIDNLNTFLVIHFLYLLKEITQKGLKKGYIKVTNNLTSKVKGKILINKTIKYNHFKNRLDKTMCNYQIFTINCIENQILKTALLQCSKYVNLLNDETITKLFKQNLNAFELVDTKEVFDSDFSKIKYSPFYKEYKEALNLAKMIFKKFGFSLKNNNQLLNKIPPYYINMPELFERYVEVKLRQNNISYIDGNEKSYTWGMRPDFLLTDKKIILDAKYKFWYENSENIDFKDDYKQLALYGRDKKIRKDLEVDKNEIIKLIFIYPDYDGNELFNFNNEDDKFLNICKLSIKIPQKGTIK